TKVLESSTRTRSSSRRCVVDGAARISPSNLSGKHPSFRELNSDTLARGLIDDGEAKNGNCLAVSFPGFFGFGVGRVGVRRGRDRFRTDEFWPANVFQAIHRTKG